MTDGRARPTAKQARRTARRAAKRTREAAGKSHLVDPPQPPAGFENPLSLMVFASMQVQALTPDPFAKYRSHQHEPIDLDYLLGRFLSEPTPEIAIFVALFAELLDDAPLKLRYQHAVEERQELLPRWTVELPNARAYKAVRITHVLGDTDQVMVGVRLVGGQEATFVVVIDHLRGSEIKDAFLSGDSIDTGLAAFSVAADPDCTVVDMTLPDARAWIEQGLRRELVLRDTATWPDCRPLLKWLTFRLPAGGIGFRSPVWTWEETAELCGEFFASEKGAPFDVRDHGDLLRELMDSGTENPLCWSAARVDQVLESPEWDTYAPLEVRLDVPDLLRAFISFAHNRSGIREGLTVDALAVVDETAMRYRRDVLRDADSVDSEDRFA
ncbi:hypothetical protein [Mycolicibacterium doricum]|nr:hypothetical protein [Mycolicibacterium doricum]MCV7269423.1 hypothetical protein [Mycolicibacterium doricum]